MSQKEEATIHCQNGVSYSSPSSWQKPPEHTIPFRYQWRHIPTGHTGTNVVYVRQSANVDNLLNAWNASGRGHWEYTRLNEAANKAA